jgi:hypothetical protein
MNPKKFFAKLRRRDVYSCRRIEKFYDGAIRFTIA